MPYATISDVQARLGRPLTADETSQATALLVDALILIKSKIPTLDDLVDDEEVDPNIVVMVQSNAVVRLLRNPDGYVSETDGDYSYQKNWKHVSGALEILEHEWSLLGINNSVFLIGLTVESPFADESYISDPTNPLFFYGPMFWNPL